MIKLLFNTIKYLRIEQIVLKKIVNILRLSYLIILKIVKIKDYDVKIPSNKNYFFDLINCPLGIRKVELMNFNFENSLSKTNFKNELLYRFHYNYFDFLRSSDKWSLNEIKKFFKKWDSYQKYQVDCEWHPYVVSRRMPNQIIWSIDNRKYSIFVKEISNEYEYLKKSLEYDIGANHLLSNFRALVFGSFFLLSSKRTKNIKKYVSLFFSELEKQILSDGGHYERSPMYQSLILQDLLDLKKLFKIYDSDIDLSWKKKLDLTIKKMAFFLHSICIDNRMLPRFHDTTGQGFFTNRLGKKKLKSAIRSEKLSFKKSQFFEATGFFCCNLFDWNFVADTGGIKANHQPGHSHAATFDFTLAFKTQSIFTGLGISTYKNSKRRFFERSPKAHCITDFGDGIFHNEVWSSFRVARRPFIMTPSISVENDFIELNCQAHSWYKFAGNFVATYERKFQISKSSVRISDNVNKYLGEGFSYYHFHPDVIIEDISNNFLIFRIGPRSFFKMHLSCKNFDIIENKFCENFSLFRNTSSVIMRFDSVSCHVLIERI